MRRKKGGYPEYLKQPIDRRKFLLEAGQGKHINGNVFALLRCLETDESWQSITPYVTVLKENREEIREKLKLNGFTRTKTVVRNSDAYKKILATAGYLVTDNSFPTYFIKRDGQVYLNTWHGTPLKQLGRADIENSTSIGNVQKNFLAADYLLFPNTYTRDIMMKDYMMEKVYAGRTLLCDYPRNDALFDEEKRTRIRREQGLEGRRVFAYMPTWRGKGRSADADSQIREAEAAVRTIESSLGENDILYVNFHFLIGDRLDYSSFEKVNPFPKELETYDFLCACDTLISDYSSVMIDFAQTGRSIIMYMYDYEDYAAGKGFYFDVRTLPFEKAYSEEELAKAVACASSGEYRLDDTFIDPCRGKGSETVLKLMIDGEGVETEDFSKQSPATVLYAGDLSSEVNRRLTDETVKDEENIVIAFENELDGPTAEYLRGLDENIDFLRIPGKGDMSRKEKICLYLNRSYGLMKGAAKEYYRREYDRLFARINCREIRLLNTDMFYRIGAISAGDRKTSVYRIPLAFYNRPNEVFYSHPASLKRTMDRFDEAVETGPDYAGEIWENNSCEGIHAVLNDIDITGSGDEITLMGRVRIRMEAPGGEPGENIEISSKVYGNRLKYTAAWQVKSRKVRSDVCSIRATFRINMPAGEFENWYSSNMISMELRAGENTYKVPLMSSRRKRPFGSRICAIGNSGPVCELKEDYRQVRLMIRQSNITDRPIEKVKLAAAFALSRIGGRKPVVLYEKNCSRYEESASAVFEKLVDMGRRDVRFILAKDYSHRDEIEPKYRKQIIDRFSFSHYYNMFAARSIISSESLDHILEKKCADRLFRKHVLNGSKNYAFLQHGVMYMVSLDAEQRAFFRKRETGGKERVVVSSRLEAEHFLDNTNYTEKDLYICGLPKFDRSVRRDDADKIVIMTTWRPWEYVTAQHNLSDTGYYSLLRLMVDSVPEELRDRLVVLPHPLVQEQVEALPPGDPVWKYYTPGRKYDEILREAQVLVTDYSSIAYDAFYRGTALVFCWRDKDDCMKEYGESAHLMLTEELAFGEVCTDGATLTEAIAKAYAEGQRKEYVENYRKIVEFSDGRNTERFIAMAKKDGIL